MALWIIDIFLGADLYSAQSIDHILREVSNLRRIGQQYSAQNHGTLSIATTHTQARYVLPQPVAKLREAYPDVSVSLHQGSPDQVARMVIEEVAEIGMATESLANIASELNLLVKHFEKSL